jgi:predicted RNase H-like nuclease (RuvC/YqgF family)
MELIEGGLYALTGVGATGLAWKVWSALHKTTTADNSTTQTYDLLSEENKRLAGVLKEQHEVIEQLKSKIEVVESSARQERLQCQGEVERLMVEIAGLKAMLKIREHEDDLARQGKIDRRQRVA